MNQDQDNEVIWLKAKEAGIVGRSENLLLALRRALNAAPTEVSVLIQGANGTGKEGMAKLIHDYSRASGRQFHPINCAAITPSLFESEMFGYEKGAFTDAKTMKMGAFEMAHGGTLFLDELGEMPLDQQAKLLRVMQSGRCRRIGSNKTEDDIEARPRIIAATNVDVSAALRDGKLREDLFYRFTRHIVLPSLSERRSDIPILVESLLQKFIDDPASKRKNGPRGFSPKALRCLEAHSWPGNIRELSNVVHNAYLEASGSSIIETDLSISVRAAVEHQNGIPEPHEGFDSKRYLDSVRDQLYRRALELTDGNLSAASGRLGISRQSLHEWSVKRA
jgi:DNA-binding NtrC family response regulator